ncbi:two sigma54 transcriptional fis family : Two component, sigma54 specific, transcriptional regulator, Fis family OS=Pirellula staleyi (strain ATCC 27377 / DSM 6068 / ICPB 4128) GN=Psta_1595 PE=4 SV=1: Response_reg: Sigma54_activat: HTH_8 [Gemmata massiliana]|uniref:Sigma-54-dependent Fis family transcriptional regulator n=1 Tax=Gemmata massiliana TaxID=1210884 RepID=A0A6P2D170_9BACT|nr:sigma-54 dependent transcriptional regulator [Gemmata massiliana]VTR94879.1 two sigma54 transcriptional fis family : Two component, sigma54 specific, transcriptional regulator, Fis family OS=Pirellula staleyi (strain ATCC 27377 / DSM 6068 / ICPB 4128) GN=Psta_1595 PE=4 SV=1: Response_reg: Sigma54_activat: HTH_8 [Gemmata massiliana]
MIGTGDKKPRGHILVVDDEVELMRALCESLTDEGFEVQGLSDPALAPDALREHECDVLLSDLMMPGTDGIQLLRKCLEIDPHLVGVIMTGQGTIQTAVEAMKAGAFDYILKPFRLQQVMPVLDRALEVRRLRVENVRLRRFVQRLTFESERYRIVGSSPAVRKIVQMIEKVAPTNAGVLVRGPSGTGKELIARALHGNSARRDKPLVTVNCATLQESLLESELFGHERGAFTGADRAKPGLFEVAEGGTLFVDEVAEMAPALQAKLLRVLEDGHYRRVGSTQEKRADVRVIAATNKPLEAEQSAGRFREDLFFRLNVISITLPPLKERREDIPELIAHFLHTRQVGRGLMTVDPVARAALCSYDWPGNIRELANVLERAQILAEGTTITPDDLPETVLASRAAVPGTEPPPPVATSPDDLDRMERHHVADVLRRHGGNKVQAAKALGVSRRTLYRLIEKHRLAAESE